MIDAQVIRSLPLSAASGLVIHGQRFFVVADDDLHLSMFRLDDADYFQALRLFTGELPVEKKARKAAKPDFEALTLLPAQLAYPHGALLVLGSGSTAQRQRAVLVPFAANDALSDAREVLDWSPLYASLQLADCNIEGALVCGEQLVLLQRGNQQQGSALVIVALADVLKTAIEKNAQSPTIIPVQLPAIDNVPLAFTDGLCLPNGNILFSAVAEVTNDSYNDGACLGAAIGEMTMQGVVLRCERVSGVHKIEGIALAQNGQLYAVTDADDPALPASLLLLQGCY